MFRQSDQRLSRRMLLSAVLFAGIGICAGVARGDDVARFLAEHDLNHVLAVHLEQQLAEATGDRRDELLQSLAGLYAQLLELTTEDDLRASLEKRGREILAQAPRDGADTLRLALLRGPYRLAERIAEQHRLRLADDEQLERASAALDRTVPELLSMVSRTEEAQKLADRRLSRAGSREATELSARAEDAQRLFDQTRFLAAWALYYRGFLTGERSDARQAEDLFSELLDPQQPDLRPELVSIDLRALESFARSILGMALCRSLTTTSADALRWLELLTTESTHELLREQVPVWRMYIHLEHEEYRNARAALLDAAGAMETAPATWLRLLAVHCAEAPRADVVAIENVRLAVTGLAAQGELEHVLDIARRYGEDLLGSSGFAMHYVSGLLVYQQARDVHGSENPPAGDEAAVLYAEAAESFEAAVNEADARDYASAAAGSLRLIGLCRFFRGEFLRARDAFVKAADALPADQAADALWMAIASLDHVVQAGENPTLRAELHALIDRFLNRFPSNRNAPKLVVRRAATMQEPDPEIVAELLSVPPNSDAYAEARSRAAEMLYGLFRRSQGDDRGEHGGEYLNAAVPLIAAAIPLGEVGATDRARLLVRCRRVLEVSLSRSVQRRAAAETAFDAIEALRDAGDVTLGEYKSELQFRRIQFELLRGDVESAVSLANGLWGSDQSSIWAVLASRLMFQHMCEQLVTDELNRTDPTPTLRHVVHFGGRVLREYEDDPDALEDRTVLSYHAVVADAAMRLWQRTGNDEMGRTALFLFEEKLLEHRPNSAGFLRSAAVLAEHFERPEFALECWRRLITGLPASSNDWFEARFKVISILATTDPQRARAVMDQFKLLHPDYGPDPWGPRLRALDARLYAAEESSSAPTQEGAES